MRDSLSGSFHLYLPLILRCSIELIMPAWFLVRFSFLGCVKCKDYFHDECVVLSLVELCQGFSCMLIDLVSHSDSSSLLDLCKAHCSASNYCNTKCVKGTRNYELLIHIQGKKKLYSK